MVKRVARHASEASLDLAAIKQQVREWTGLKEQLALMNKRQGELKKRLSVAVEEFGEEDDKGHLRLELDEDVAGISSLQRQRRVSQGFNEDVARDILDRYGLHDRCYEMVEVLNEDEVLAAHYEGLLPEEDIDSMFPKTVSYAFVTK